MTRCGLEGARPVRPRILRILRAFNRLGHDFNLRDALAALTMSRSDAVGARIAAADDQYILSFGGNALVLREFHASEDTVLLREQFEGEMHAFQFAARGLEIAGGGSAGGDDDSVVIAGYAGHSGFSGYSGIILKLDALLLQQGDAAIDDGLVELEIGDAVAQEATGSFVLLEDGDLIAHQVQVVGGSESGRTGTNNSHLLPIANDVCARLDIALAESSLNDGAFILAVGSRLVVETVQHAGFLAERRTDAARELREGIGRREQAISLFPVAFIQRVVPFRRLVAQRTSPVAEGHAAVHTARGLQFAFAGAERLLYLAKIVDSIVNRTVTRLLAVYL